jgi:diacylglycerol kinase (ATP)
MIGVVVNPASGHGRAGRQWPAIEAELRRAFEELDIRLTAAPGDGTRLAQELLDAGVDTIIAVGGDGTCQEVANSGCPCLGVLAVGSAGDFARTLGAPRGWRAGIEWLRRAKPAPIDLGCATYTADNGERVSRRFLNMASLGLGGRVVRRTGTPYLLATLQEMRAPCPRLRMEIDGEAHSGRFLHVAIGNGQYQGSAMHVCPNAALDDGWLDITAIEPVGVFELALNLRKVYSGALLRHPKVRAWRGQCFTAASDGPVAIDLDGEPAGYLPLEIRMLRSAMRVLR